MCDCRKDLEEKILARFKTAAPDAKDHCAELSGYTFLLCDSGVTEVGCMVFKLTASHPLKKGGFKEKTERSNMIFTFCPFCGEKYKKGGEK